MAFLGHEEAAFLRLQPFFYLFHWQSINKNPQEKSRMAFLGHEEAAFLRLQPFCFTGNQ